MAKKDLFRNASIKNLHSFFGTNKFQHLWLESCNLAETEKNNFFKEKCYSTYAFSKKDC